MHEITKSYSKEGIHKVFDEISPTYDLVNQILSFGLDRYWRNKLSNFLKNCNNCFLLDLATGTGDQIFSILAKNPFVSKAIGIDLSSEMLNIAKYKSSKKVTPKVDFLIGDALSLNFENNFFDIVTMSFGIRNVTSIQRCFCEMLRVLKPNGRAYILEFSLPKNCVIKSLYLLYLRKILPKIGGFISKKPIAYSYLNKTIESFPYGESLKQEIAKAGFKTVNSYTLTCGITTIYEAIK